MSSRLRGFYNDEIVPEMTKKFSYKNKLAVPKIEKIIINMGVGEAKDNAKVLDGAVKDLTIISGQKPIITKAKKSVAAFKLREGMPIGCKCKLIISCHCKRFDLRPPFILLLYITHASFLHHFYIIFASFFISASILFLVSKLFIALFYS